MAVLVFGGCCALKGSHCLASGIAIVMVARGLEGRAALGHVWSQCEHVQNCLELVGGVSIAIDSAVDLLCR